MPNRLYLVGYYLINLGFLFYGLLRLVGAVPAFAHLMGWWDNPIGSEVTSKLEASWPKLLDRAFVELPVEIYMGWSMVMGIVLTLGSALALFKIRSGYVLMGSYYVLFGIMHLNYPSFDVKLFHFVIGLSLLILMVFLAKRSRQQK